MIEAGIAHKLGLVNHVVPAEFLLNTAIVLLQKILTRSPLAVAAAIRAVNAGYNDTGFQYEIQEFANCFGTADFREGTSAFLEKRQAIFG
jgi:enoyl-CoA hydratase